MHSHLTSLDLPLFLPPSLFLPHPFLPHPFLPHLSHLIHFYSHTYLNPSLVLFLSPFLPSSLTPPLLVHFYPTEIYFFFIPLLPPSYPPTLHLHSLPFLHLSISLSLPLSISLLHLPLCADPGPSDSVRR